MSVPKKTRVSYKKFHNLATWNLVPDKAGKIFTVDEKGLHFTNKKASGLKQTGRELLTDELNEYFGFDAIGEKTGTPASDGIKMMVNKWSRARFVCPSGRPIYIDISYDDFKPSVTMLVAEIFHVVCEECDLSIANKVPPIEEVVAAEEVFIVEHPIIAVDPLNDKGPEKVQILDFDVVATDPLKSALPLAPKVLPGKISVLESLVEDCVKRSEASIRGVFNSTVKTSLAPNDSTIKPIDQMIEMIPVMTTAIIDNLYEYQTFLTNFYGLKGAEKNQADDEGETSGGLNSLAQSSPSNNLEPIETEKNKRGMTWHQSKSGSTAPIGEAAVNESLAPIQEESEEADEGSNAIVNEQVEEPGNAPMIYDEIEDPKQRELKTLQRPPKRRASAAVNNYSVLNRGELG